MKLYTDAFTGTEVLSDSYKFIPDYEGTVNKVRSRLVVKSEDNVDIGCGNAFGTPAEEQAGGDPNVEKVIDLVDAFGYEETSYDKPQFEKYFKGYMKKVLDYLKANKKDRVDTFMKGARALFEWIKANFGDLTFYTPKDYDCENIVIMSYYEEGALAPTFIYIMDGLK